MFIRTIDYDVHQDNHHDYNNYHDNDNYIVIQDNYNVHEDN